MQLMCTCGQSNNTKSQLFIKKKNKGFLKNKFKKMEDKKIKI